MFSVSNDKENGFLLRDSSCFKTLPRLKRIFFYEDETIIARKFCLFKI